MRIEKRIPVIIEALKDDENKRKVLEYWFKPKVGTQLEIGMPYLCIDDFIKSWNKYYKSFSGWKKYPDLRLGQVLAATGILPNIPVIRFYEDEEVMIESKVLEEREILFWKNKFDKNDKLLKKVNYVLIKDMNTNHIEKILKLKQKIRKDYIEAFKKEIELRKKK